MSVDIDGNMKLSPDYTLAIRHVFFAFPFILTINLKVVASMARWCIVALILVLNETSIYIALRLM